MKRKICFVFTLVFMLIISFATIDYFRIQNEKDPLFAINVYTIKDGGTKEYFGLGYRIYDYNTINGKDDYEFGTWFLKYKE